MTKHAANDNAEAMKLEEALRKAEQLCSKAAATKAASASAASCSI